MMSAKKFQRNLLFGLLAARLDFMTSSDLVISMQEWLAQGKSPPLGEFLVERRKLDEATRAVLHELAERHVDVHGGDLRGSLSSLGSFPGIEGWLRTVTDEEVRLAVLPPETTPSHVDSEEDCDSPHGCGGTSTSNSQLTVPWKTEAREENLTLSWDEPEIDYGRYTILKSIAKGGLGEVFLARDEGLNRDVALKIIQPNLANHPLCRARFLVEAEVNGGLEHPGIVPVYAMGICDDGRPFYAMRLIHGESLETTIARYHAETDGGERARKLMSLLRHFIIVCDVVEYAHSRGIIHRDIKPANIMVGRYGETMLVDWGLAKPIGQPDPSEATGCFEGREPMILPQAGTGVTPTAIGTTVGTPRYMSAEQALGDLDRIGPLSDVANLGATLYRILTGRDPLNDVDNLQDVLKRVSRGEIPPVREILPGVSSTLDGICRKAMALKPEDRYRSARALAEDIERWMADLPTTVPESAGARLGRWERRNRLLIRVAGVVLLTMTVVAVLAMFFLEVT